MPQRDRPGLRKLGLRRRTRPPPHRPPGDHAMESQHEPTQEVSHRAHVRRGQSRPHRHLRAAEYPTRIWQPRGPHLGLRPRRLLDRRRARRRHDLFVPARDPHSV